MSTVPDPKSKRLARAVRQLESERLADGRWRVTGGAAAQIVDAQAQSCDCADHAYRGGICAHLARVRLRLGDAETVRALRDLPPRALRGGGARLRLPRPASAPSPGWSRDGASVGRDRTGHGYSGAWEGTDSTAHLPFTWTETATLTCTAG